MNNEEEKDLPDEYLKQENDSYRQYTYDSDPTLPKKKSFFKTGWGILVIVLICIVGIPLLLFGACMLLIASH